MPIQYLSYGFRRILALTVLFCLLFVSGALAGPINAKSAILMDVTTGRILYEQRADMKIPPASLTKVISMYVAMNAISDRKADYHDKVKISSAAARTGGSRFGLRAGERVTLDKLFYGMAVASGNDASVAVAEHVAGSTSAFVKRMNSLARRLGMKNTRFVNVHGLPAKGQLTTARDMLKLAPAYQAHYPIARKYHLARSVTHRGHTEPNHNPLVGHYTGLDGLKTGWVTAAGYNIIVTARQRGHKLIAVILGAPNSGVRAAEAKTPAQRRLLRRGKKEKYRHSRTWRFRKAGGSAKKVQLRRPPQSAEKTFSGSKVRSCGPASVHEKESRSLTRPARFTLFTTDIS